MAPTQRSTVFLHSRLERTPRWPWMCVFLLPGSAIAALAKRSMPLYLRGSPIFASSWARKVFTDRRIHRAPDCVTIGHTRIVVPWHYLLHLHCPIQTNLTRYADSTNSASGVLSMTNVFASFAAESLMAGKFKCKAAQAGTDHNG